MRTASQKSLRESRRLRNCSGSLVRGGPAIGLFFSVLFLVITLYWVYRGLRRGAYPALNILFVFFVPLLVTLNYYDLLFGLVARIKPDTTETTRETICFAATYLVTFFICGYFCLWLCAETLHLSKAVDTIAGGILGAMTGAICCGVLMLIWFSLPLSREAHFEVNDADMFYKPQSFALEAATVVAGRIKEDRTFSGERFMRDIRYGLPQVPTLGGGIYFSSVPTGLKVFSQPGGVSPESFLVMIKERLNNPEKDIPPSEQKNAVFEKGRTPLLLRETAGNALVAVVMENVPLELTQMSGDNPDMVFASDGEIGYAKEFVSDRPVYIKFYRIGKTGSVSSEIALFQPRNAAAKDFDDFWPAKACFRFNGSEVELGLRKFVAPEQAKAFVGSAPWTEQLRTCGKITFRGSDGKDYALELSAPTQPARFFEVKPALNLNASPGVKTGR
jgi:hypothetical protein